MVFFAVCDFARGFVIKNRCDDADDVSNLICALKKVGSITGLKRA